MRHRAIFLASLFIYFAAPALIPPSSAFATRHHVSAPDSSYFFNSVSAVVVHPNGSLSAIADGVYLSSNAGNSWKPIGTSRKLSDAVSIAVDRNGRLLVGTQGYGIFEYKPSNGRWNRIDTLLPDKTTLSLLIDSRNHIIAGTGSTIVYRSTDDGVHWNALSLEDYQARAISVGQNGWLFSESSDGYMMSTDHGDSWEHVQCPDRGAYCAATDSAGTIYVGTYGRIYLARDNAGAWECVYRDDSSKTRVSCILVHRDGRLFAGLESGLLLVSSDAGRTWRNSSFSQPHPYPVLCLTANRRGYIFVGTDGSGVYRSVDNGITWQQINNGIKARVFGG